MWFQGGLRCHFSSLMNFQTRVKICGITSPEDANRVVASGADAIGLVFYPPSSRYVELAQAKAIAEMAGPFVTVVALFVNPRVEEVKQVLNNVAVDCLQFHGDETPDFCQQFSRPYMKAVKVPPAEANDENAISRIQQDVIHQSRSHQDQSHQQARAILLDTLHPKHVGGSGERFDWRCVPSSNSFRWVLAGGLNPDNVADAVEQVKPYAVDVSSGVESQQGVKDPEKVRQFIANVRAAK